MQQNNTVNLDSLRVVYQGRYADIHQEQDSTSNTAQHAYKTFRSMPNDAGAVSRLNLMINGLHMQRLQIGSVEQSRISWMSTANASTAGTPVPAIKMVWYKNGNVLVYLSRNANVNRMSLVTDIAHGLATLHSLGIIHDNIHPGNVLITDDHRACVADVGVYASAMQALNINHMPVPLQCAYKSPEALRAGVRSSQTDVYSFACTVYSIYTGKSLLKNSTSQSARDVLNIMERGHGSILGKPLRMSEKLWDLLKRCWAVNPAGRPTMRKVLEELSALGPE